jgi:hypothetical protein
MRRMIRIWRIAPLRPSLHTATSPGFLAKTPREATVLPSVIPQERAKRASVGIHCPGSVAGAVAAKVDPDRRCAPAG